MTRKSTLKSAIAVIVFLISLQAAPASPDSRSNPQAIPVLTPPSVAILAFDSLSNNGNRTDTGRMVSEMLTTAAVKSGCFAVVERHLLDKVLEEIYYGRRESKVSMVQKIGDLVGADVVLSGSVVEMGGELRIDARLVRVEDGAVVYAESAYAKTRLQSVAKAAEQIIQAMTSAVTPVIAALEKGQEAWVAPSALLAGPDAKLWLAAASHVRSKSEEEPLVMVKRGDDGFIVDVTGCRHKWRKSALPPGVEVIPVAKIIH